jgi:hypothetical protein
MTDSKKPPKVIGIRIEVICNGEVTPGTEDYIERRTSELIEWLADLNGTSASSNGRDSKILDVKVRRTDRELVCSDNETLLTREFRIHGRSRLNPSLN